ncbi:MAG TPA: NAD(P)H-dependent oxidoreductase [Candidatus Saccharimonadales bacterium]|jgi:putative NADPH-quinone reductase|nr:NAD(P)H-dependent oxidoreductase [Candidatus Saccharimonadales bacterium]
MNILIIVANPRENSFSHQIAEAYREGAVLTNKAVEVLDLYASDMQLGFLRPESTSEYARYQPVREGLQDLIQQAQELVIIHPLWWGGPPAILKNMIDQVLTPGFAYQRVRRKWLPIALDSRRKSLLKGKSVRLFITSDQSWWQNSLRLLPYLNIWYFDILRPTGLKLSSFRLFDYMHERTGLRRSKWLAQVNKLAAK